MARILYNDQWFEEIASWGHYEIEFENVLRQEAVQLFSNYYLIPYKTTVYSEIDADARQPDFALIHKSYRSWWVVEVELGHHPFEAHVFPQVRTLSRALYGVREADYLCQQQPDLNKRKVLEMFKGALPAVLVIVNSPVEGWAEQLRPFGARLVICQVFRSRFNRYVLRLNGEYPSDNDEVITTCECSPLLRRLLVIHAPTQLPVSRGERILLYYEGRALEWERIDTATQVFLHAVRGHNLEPRKQFEIIRQTDGTFAIKHA